MTLVQGALAQYPSLKGKVVFITGGGTSIGALMVERFIQQGAQVAFVDIAEIASTALVQRLTGQYAYTPRFYVCDLRDIDALQRIIAQVGHELGDIGVLINNAADDSRHDIESMTVEYWDERFAINLRPSFFAVQAVLPQMQRLGGGSVINLGSISWRLKQSAMPAYTTAKAGIEGLTRSLAGRLGADNIRINSLIPGWVMTEKQRLRWITEETEKEIHRGQSLKTPLMPEDIVNMALFLAADDSRMISAQSIIVDGGWV